MNQRITPENYEAWLLDHAEGRLSEAQVAELMRFLEAHPHLNEDIDFTDLPALTHVETGKTDWSVLHMPDASERELLFFKAVEGTLSNEEQQRLDTILTNPAHAREFEMWQHTTLQVDQTAMETAARHGLFRFGHDSALNDATWEHWLIAYSEGLLSEKQTEDLRKYAAAKPDGVNELTIAGRLRLQPARGIFFPDKEKLRKKERSAVLFLLYRAAGVAAAVLLAFGLWITVYDSADTAPIASDNGDKKTVAGKDTTSAVKPDTLIKSKSAPAPAVQPVMPESDFREPQPYELARHTAPQNEETNPLIEKQLPVHRPELPEVDEHMAQGTDKKAQVDETEQLFAESVPTEQALQRPASSKTLSEIAEEKLAQRLALTDEEKDALALTLAKRAADRAGSLLNTEVSKTSSETELGENQVYKVRIGTFKVTHSRTK